MKKYIFLFLCFFPIISNSQIKIFSDFENGNVDIISINDTSNCIVFQPSLIDKNNTTRCWFYYGISGFDTTTTLRFEEIYSNHYTAPNTPVYSYDNKLWHRLHVDSLNKSKKYFSGKFKSDTLWFSAGYPYTYSDNLNYIDSISQNRFVDTSTLTYSEKGLKIPMFEIRDTNSNIKNMIWIIGRQHAFETTLNYVLEGMTKYFISDEKYAKKMRKKTTIYVVPMMDVDNVIQGASGRMQKPIDFNRDWSTSPHWNAIKAVQKKIKETNEVYNYRIFLDVHSTYPGTTKPIFGFFNEYKNHEIYFHKLKYFLKIFEKTNDYSLVEIGGNPNQLFADAFNMGMRDKDIIVSDFSSTIECDWNINTNGKELTINELKISGYKIAQAICIYLSKNRNIK